jgi:CHAD domain-containing protein
MSFELHHRKHIEDELEQIVRRQLRRACRSLRARDAAALRTAVHESRKSVKKVRAVVALLERTGADVPRKDRKRLKAVGRALAPLRDSTAIIDTFDRVRRRYPQSLPEHTYRILRRGLVAARDRQERRAWRGAVAADVGRRLEKIRRSAKSWPAPRIDLDDFIAIVADSYRRGRKTMRRAKETAQSATIHRWRRDLKTLWYQLRLVKRLAAGVAPTVAAMKRLETALGDDHNLVVLGATLRACPELRSMRAAVRIIDDRAVLMRTQLRRRAFRLGGRISMRTPKAFRRWLRGRSESRPRAAAA